jgi:hypothetical protein
VARPNFWALLISGVQLLFGGELKKDTTMKPVVTVKALRKLLSKDHPPFVILYQHKLIYIGKEAGEILDRLAITTIDQYTQFPAGYLVPQSR